MPDHDDKPDDEPDMGAELDVLEARLLASRKRIEALKSTGSAAKLIASEKSSQTNLPRLSIAEIDAKLDEVREARRARQSMPFPMPKSTRPPKK